MYWTVQYLPFFSIVPSDSRSVRDLLRNERPDPTLSGGGGYRLRHCFLVAEEKGVGGTPSFRNELSFDFGQLNCFLPRLVLESLRARPGVGDSSFYPFWLSRTATQTSGMISY